MAAGAGGVGTGTEAEAEGWRLGWESGEVNPSSCEMRLCLFNRSRLVKAAPQKQMNGFSLVSDDDGQPPPR